MPPENTGRFSSWRFIIAFAFTVILVSGGYVAWRIYGFGKNAEGVRRLVERLERIQKENYDRAMADTYGGQTPQETLRLYIDAIEKGDYDLASKYFIFENQEKEKESFINADESNKTNYILLIRQAFNSQSEFSDDKNSFYIEKPIWIKLIKYPNGIWKIVEI